MDPLLGRKLTLLSVSGRLGTNNSCLHLLMSQALREVKSMLFNQALPIGSCLECSSFVMFYISYHSILFPMGWASLQKARNGGSFFVALYFGLKCSLPQPERTSKA